MTIADVSAGRILAVPLSILLSGFFGASLASPPSLPQGPHSGEEMTAAEVAAFLSRPGVRTYTGLDMPITGNVDYLFKGIFPRDGDRCVYEEDSFMIPQGFVFPPHAAIISVRIAEDQRFCMLVMRRGFIPSSSAP